ncbi:MAG: exodeoxyribonuclease VII small subunit [Eubacteriales bacterium]|nr:exodeoxyribonuclease VII small subunit [Eubacteriales bacterium]
MEEKVFSLEEGFEKIEELLAILENRDTTLEQSFEAYREGMELLKKCNDQIDMVEKKMKVINGEGELSDF